MDIQDQVLGEIEGLMDSRMSQGAYDKMKGAMGIEDSTGQEMTAGADEMHGNKPEEEGVRFSPEEMQMLEAVVVEG